jgi:hypothetical protein
MDPQNTTQVPPIVPVNPVEPITYKSNIIVPVLSILVFLLICITVYLAYQNMKLQKQITSLEQSTTPSANMTPIPSALETATPSSSTSTTLDPTANWKTYTNTNQGYLLKYPENLEPNESQYDTEFNIIETQPGGSSVPAYYISVIPDGFWQSGAIYDDPTADFIPSLLALKIGDTYKNGTDSFIRLQDTTVDTSQAMVYENTQVFEYSGKERVALIKKNQKTYMVGTYYSTSSDLSNFQILLSTFKFTK